MKTYLLEPRDVLFFRDARPIDLVGGHGARWPDPPLIFDALHAALYRAFPDIQPWEHKHRLGRSSSRDYCRERTERFGSLATVGLFPVLSGQWLHPAPADWRVDESGRGSALAPVILEGTNLPAPLRYGLANPVPPSKREVPPWWSVKAWEAYLSGGQPSAADLWRNGDVFSAEWRTGIGIDPERGTQDGERIYSAEYLRLRPDVEAGFLASLPMKQNGDPSAVVECLGHLLNGASGIIIGGQQRVCTVRHAENAGPLLPRAPKITGTRVKWVLLTPAIFPAIPANPAKNVPPHPGGWLPSWIDGTSGDFRLLDGPGGGKAGRSSTPTGQPIRARLVAACIPKPRPISGWSEQLNAEIRPGGTNAGHKPTHLAVPAGAVYYFEATSPEDAQKLASALNWHGAGGGAAIKNRRSTIMGEKGLGLGVCGTWDPLETVSPADVPGRSIT